MVDRISYSKLKAFLHSPRRLWQYINKQIKDTDAIAAGSLVDCLLFTPDAFDEKFYLIDELPSRDSKAYEVFKMAQAKLALVPEGEDVSLTDVIIECIDLVGYQQNWKPDTRYGKFLEQNAAMIQAIAESGGRQVVDNSEVLDAEQDAEAIRNNQAVIHNGLLECMPQVECNFRYRGFEHRGIMDALCTDRLTWDLKRVGRADSVQSARRAARDNYFLLQGLMYTEAVKQQTGKALPFANVIIGKDREVIVLKATRDDLEGMRSTWDMCLNRLRVAEVANAALLDEEQKADRKRWFSQGVEYWATSPDYTFSY